MQNDQACYNREALGAYTRGVSGVLKTYSNRCSCIITAVIFLLAAEYGAPADNTTPVRPLMPTYDTENVQSRPAPRPFQRRPGQDAQGQDTRTRETQPRRINETVGEIPTSETRTHEEDIATDPYDTPTSRSTTDSTSFPGESGDSSERLIGIKYADESLEQVLKDYSDYTGRAIMKAPDVAPNLKITLKCPTRIPKQEALLAIETVLAMHGIALVPMGENFLKVVQIGVARKSGMETQIGPLKEEYADTGHLISQIIPVKHLELSDAQSTVQNLLHPYGNIVPLQQINSLLITDGAVNIKRILEILEHIDQPVELREELRIFQVVHAKASEIQGKIEAIIAETESKSTTPFIRRTIPIASQRRPTPTPVVRTAETTDSQDGMIKGKVKMVADDRTNVLIIITRPEQFDFLERMIKALDQQVEPSVLIKVYRLEYAKAEDVLSVLTSLVSSTTPESKSSARVMPPVGQVGQEQPAASDAKDTLLSGTMAADVKVLSDARSNSLIIMATRSDMKVIENVLTKLDIMMKQVLIEVVILEIGLRDSQQTGVDWLQRSMVAYDLEQNGERKPIFGFTGSSRMGTDGRIIEAASVRSVNNNPTGEGSGLSYFFSLYDLNIDAVINMLASTTEARILSTPIILTTDNKEAKIIVGEKRPIVTSTSISSGGTQQSAYEYTDIGIELTVTPHINQKGFVVMDLQQKVDNVAGNELIDGNRVPIITTREFGASIAVDDGRTIVVGGLASTEHGKDRTKIPILGDIPILGTLFRFDDRSKQRRELLVLITPYVLDTPGDAQEQTRKRRDFMSDEQEIWEYNWAQTELSSKKSEQEKALESRPWWKFWGKSRKPADKTVDDSELYNEPPTEDTPRETNPEDQEVEYEQ